MSSYSFDGSTENFVLIFSLSFTDHDDSISGFVNANIVPSFEKAKKTISSETFIEL